MTLAKRIGVETTTSAVPAPTVSGREKAWTSCHDDSWSHDTFEFRDIVLNLQMLSKQIEFVLHNYTMDDQRLFDFFKRLEMMLLKLQQSTPGYDESKALCGFIYEVYAGWSWLDGYRDYDIIEKMIADI